MTTEIARSVGTPRRAPWRARDARATTPRGAAYTRARDGFTILELLGAMMLFGVLVGTAMAALPRRPYAVWNAQAGLVAELRRARNDALTKGAHFRVEMTNASTWSTYRLSLVGGAWVPDAEPVRTGTLPDGLQFVGGVGKRFEFNTRGLLTAATAAASVVITDVDTAKARTVTVWPSGQVASA